MWRYRLCILKFLPFILIKPEIIYIKSVHLVISPVMYNNIENIIVVS